MKHARLSASAAHRWLVCAPSANFSGGASSAYAAEGTFAHDIAAKCLQDPSLSPSDFLLKTDTIDGHQVECGLEMVDGVQAYLDAVEADVQKNDLTWVEMPLLEPLSTVDPDLGGTADFVRYRPGDKSLRVFDFKYGAGVYVEVNDNKQMKIYALGALIRMLATQHLVERVTVTVVQPRFEGAMPVRDYHFKAIELLDFATDLREAAEKSRDPSAPLVAGEHCKFCPAARTCPELEKRQHALMAADFPLATPLGAYSPEQLAEALVAIPLVKARITAIEEFAYTEAMAGKPAPGFKLVDKRPTRKWVSEDVVAMWAKQHAVDPYAEPKILSVAQLEKRLEATAPRGKKKEAVKVLEPMIEKVSSGYVLVPESDDRPPAKLVNAQDFPLLPA